MKNILLLCACLLALATPLRAAVVPPADIVVVRIYEDVGLVKVIITRGEGKSEKIELAGAVDDKRHIQSNEGCYRIFQQLYQEGYILQSTIPLAVPGDIYNSFVTLLFVKAPSDTTK